MQDPDDDGVWGIQPLTVPQPYPSIRSLSFEILAAIFEQYDSTDEVFSSEDIPLPSTNIILISNGPWTLSLICSYWRRVALSLPMLWNSISITKTAKDDTDNPLDEDGVLYFIHEGLRRSGNQLLTIQWEGKGAVNSTLPIFSLHLGCLGNASFEHLSEADWSFLPTVSFLSLESIRLDQTEILLGFGRKYMIRGAPLLRIVKVYDVTDPFMIDLPWDHVTDLVLCNNASAEIPGMETSRDCLWRCPNLQRLENVNPGCPFSEGVPFTGSNLKYLFVWDLRDLGQLQLPHLETLCINHSIEDEELMTVLNVLEEFLVISQCALRALDLDFCSLSRFPSASTRTMAQCLEYVPLLMTLSLSIPWKKNVLEYLVQSLTINPHSSDTATPTLCPVLSSLSIVLIKGRTTPSIDTVAGLCNNDILRMVSSRGIGPTEGGGSLAHFKLRMTRLCHGELKDCYSKAEVSLLQCWLEGWNTLQDHKIEIYLIHKGTTCL